jgi:hypothetical protein
MTTNSTFVTKFKTNLNLLQSAVNREVDLDIRHPKVYKKIVKFYRNEGVQFYNDPDDDYELVLDLIAEDLQNAGAIAS